MDVQIYETKNITTKKTNYQKIIVIFLMMVILFFSQITGVKAELFETIATIIFYLLVTVFICAGIGWWQRRQEGGDTEGK